MERGETVKKETSSRRLLEGVTSVYLVLMCTVFLLWPGTGGYMSISSAKYTLFLILSGGYAGLMLLLHLEEALIGGMELPLFRTLLTKSSWTQRFVVLYLVLTWLSAFLSPHWPRVLQGVSRNEGALTITLYCLCFLFLSVYTRLRPWMLWAAGGAVLIFDLLSVIQLLGGNPLNLYPEGMTYFDANIRYSGAYLGTIGNVGHVASFFCVAVPALWVAAIRLKGRRRLAAIVVLAMTLAVTVRMWVLAAVVGILLGCILSLPVVLPLTRRKQRTLVPVILLCLIAAGAAVYCFDFGGTLHEFHELLHGRGEDSFGTGRLYIWRKVAELIPTRLWFGYGPDTMLLANIEPFARVDETLGTVIRARIDTAHNEYLNILFHQGIFSLLAYLGALGTALWGWIRRGRGSVAGAAAGAAVLCYAIQALFGISVCISAPYFWIALAILDGENRR